MSYRYLVVALIVYATPLWAHCPSFAHYLNQPTLRALREAQQVTLEDTVFLRKFKDKHEYNVTILYSRDFQKMVVVLGEQHFKSAYAAAAGKNVIREFKLRGFETAPSNELVKLSYEDQISFLATYQYLSMVFSDGSTINELLKDGLTLAPASWTNLPAKVRMDYDEFMHDDLDPMIEANAFVNVALETGCSFEPASLSDKSYLIHNRNDRFAENIVNILSKITLIPSILTVVGKGHTAGLSEILVNQYNFEKCEL